MAYRIFLSHSTVDLDYVVAIANALHDHQLASFIAARDIPRTTEWLPKIEYELRRCDALIAFLSPAFQASEWGDQETGYALAMGKPIIPLRRSADAPKPYGFLSRFQAIDAEEREAADVAEAVFDCLLEHDAERAKLVDIIIGSIEAERDQERLHLWVSRLQRVRDLVDPPRYERLSSTLTRNAVLRLDSRARAAVMDVIGLTP